MMTDAQCRAARAILDWSREKLAEKASISVRTVADFERGARTPHKNNIKAIKIAFETAGVVLGQDGSIYPPVHQLNATSSPSVS